MTELLSERADRCGDELALADELTELTRAELERELRARCWAGTGRSISDS